MPYQILRGRDEEWHSAYAEARRAGAGSCSGVIIRIITPTPRAQSRDIPAYL